MKKILLIALMGLTLTLQAQTKDSLSISLKQAIKVGLQNSSDLKAKGYNVDLAKNNLNKSKKVWIPTIKAEGNAQYNTQLPPTRIPKGFLGFKEGGLITLGAKSTSAFGLTLDQPIFKPGITTNVKIDKVNIALQEEKINGNKITLKNTIAMAYLNVLLKKLQYQIAKEEENRYKEYSLLMKGKYENGALIKNDFLRAELDYKNAKVKTATTKQNYGLSLQKLNYQINIPKETQLVLTDSIGHIDFKNMQLQSTFDVDNRTEIKQLQLQQQGADLEIKKMRQNALPTVSLQGYYAQMYQNDNFRYNESKWWAPHSYIGLNISIPITGNFSNKNNIQKYQLQQNQLKYQLKQQRETIQYQVQKATIDLQNSQQNMQSAKENYALSQDIYKNQQQQFAIGVFNYSNLLDTEQSLRKTESNYMQSVYEYMRDEIAYLKALGEL